ncbi:MAG: NAD(P)H-dependent oxidoreductase subunit E [Gammaproteobacteria bacterium]|nr:NAD(P)H-dependent oxidoreductase subunit E [Gammaproteobacteria bacterium]MDH3408770.1 NAD(P)H-dependent oxidoreductase subunit E [Gammaproteobacteria bacterium]MDH3551178.1 NAD(P)H-dependent oxidoreductase subunit E [Gammaproteobacteria bacterium]
MKTEAYNETAASEIIARFDARPELLLQVLRAFIERFGWISEDAIRFLSARLNLSRAEVHGVVSYYHDFRTTPPGRHIVKICQAESCQAMGSRELSAHAVKTLGVEMHSGNRDVTLEPVYCLGNCACSPAVMVDDKTYGRVSTAQFDAIVAAFEGSR